MRAPRPTPKGTSKNGQRQKKQRQKQSKLDTDPIKTLEKRLQGDAEAKLNLFGDIIYRTCKDKFGEIISKQRTIPRERGSREKESVQLVQRCRQLRKN